MALPSPQFVACATCWTHSEPQQVRTQHKSQHAAAAAAAAATRAHCICNNAHAQPSGQRRVLWHNLREEPVLYINGKPYVVREADQPFCNVEYTGACFDLLWVRQHPGARESSQSVGSDAAACKADCVVSAL